MPTAEEIARARIEIEKEDAARLAYWDRPDIKAITDETSRRSKLPSEDIDHIHGISCDGQDGASSYCIRLRMKLFGRDR